MIQRRFATMSDGYKLFHEGQIALAQVEDNGIRIDEGYLQQAIIDVGKQIKDFERELKSDKQVWKHWQKVYGGTAKLGSREQLAKVLFDPEKGMGYTSPKETASGGRSSDDGKSAGRNSADREALETVDQPFIKTFLRMEKLKKLKSTYLEGIAREVCNGYLHTSFNLNTVATYRSSSSNPNLQNVPVRDAEIMQWIRRCFIPRKGHRLIEEDYSGIEVRVAACYHKDPVMLEYILDKSKDMHRDMAGQIYCLDMATLEKTDKSSYKQARYAAKNMYVFPQFYGSVWFQCAPNLWAAIDHLKIQGPGGESLRSHLKKQGIKRLGEYTQNEEPEPGTFFHHLKEVEEDFWGNRFSVYSAWKDKWYNQYRHRGFFNMLTGFRVSGLLKRNEVLNYAVQGSAFHCLLWSLIRTQNKLNKRKMGSRIVGQIHDSMIADVPDNETQDYLHLVRKVMTEDLLRHWRWIITPLDIEAEVTPIDGSWLDKKQWAEVNGLWQAV